MSPLQIEWDARPIDFGSHDRLPTMRTEIFLKSAKRKIIIDTKYYADALQEHHGVRSFHSGNLYQLYSYLKNAAAADPDLTAVEGMLLYPTTGHSIDASYFVQDHKVRIATVDLNAPWVEIDADLRRLVSASPAS